MITARQINRLLVEFNKKGQLNMSPMKAGMSRKTAAKYVKLNDPQDPPKVRHTWRTRPDGFVDVWPVAEAILVAAPELEAKIIFEYFLDRFPGRFQEGHLRTFQRRVQQWRTMHGADKEIHFAQIQPARRSDADGLDACRGVADHDCRSSLPSSAVSQRARPLQLGVGDALRQ